MTRTLFPALALAIFVAQTASAQVRTAAPAVEPEPVQLLRIDMRKALLAQDSAPKIAAARAAKLKALQAVQNPTDPTAVANAEVELIEAQAGEKTAILQARIIEAQLRDAIRNAAQIPARQAAGQAEISVLQIEVQKAEVQADAANRVADNRKRVLEALQSQSASADKIADAQADVEGARTNAGLVALEVDAAKIRLDSANRSLTAQPPANPNPAPAPAPAPANPPYQPR